MADAAVQPIAEPQQPARWSLAHRLAFRFFCCYWILYALPEPGRVGLIPFGDFLFKPYGKLWHALAPWVATHVFHIAGAPATYFRTGSGDTTLQYVHNLLYVVVALAATAVWSVLDRRRPNYRTLGAWLRVLVRYNLAFTLFGYGFAKIVPLQFQRTLLFKMMEPYGDFSPMGVLWSFMGASLPYVIYSGCAEVLGGMLLLFRRTTTLGALVSFAVMLNVAVLNYCYDVPVKLYSTNLVLMAVFLLIPDLRRLFDIFVRNRAVPCADLNPIRFERRKLRIAQRSAGSWWSDFTSRTTVSVHGRDISGRTRNQYDRRTTGCTRSSRADRRNWRKVAIDFPNTMSSAHAPPTAIQPYSTR